MRIKTSFILIRKRSTDLSKLEIKYCYCRPIVLTNFSYNGKDHLIFLRVGKYDYRIQMVNKTRTFHANMLKKYEEREEQFKNDKLKEVQSRREAEECAGVAVVDEHILLHEGIDEIELPVYESQQTETYKDVIIDPNLIADKRAQLEELIFEFKDIFFDLPGKTNLIEVDIKME